MAVRLRALVEHLLGEDRKEGQDGEADEDNTDAKTKTRFHGTLYNRPVSVGHYEGARANRDPQSEGARSPSDSEFECR